MIVPDVRCRQVCAAEQVWQVPRQVPAQQRPSRQLSVVHCAERSQAERTVRSGTHWPEVLQWYEARQFPSEAHAVGHVVVVPLQR